MFLPHTMYVWRIIPGWDNIWTAPCHLLLLYFFLFPLFARRHVSTHHFGFENRHLGVLGQHAMATLFFHPLFSSFPLGRACIISLARQAWNKTFTLSICSSTISTYLCLSQLKTLRTRRTCAFRRCHVFCDEH
ncbi:hypothetical protein M431DRAFT_174069 [Trichoderma harzianum CBS 226.95]|uniref:Uncharacterized protein n=1 Tax=Trichoderma harzianum CBS 226.95 TaxID=983964 RepID=A0A2T4ATB3_TRIHA|nr:hypothetical protein M431DRAFT_174069 [Trichoderma harzianum CBS 226.95]PTB60218.1 hypothetical protein M431DRAFT_174069 [Trichoderma harzianum CBS 226.95]